MVKIAFLSENRRLRLWKARWSLAGLNPIFKAGSLHLTSFDQGKFIHAFRYILATHFHDWNRRENGFGTHFTTGSAPISVANGTQ